MKEMLTTVREMLWGESARRSSPSRSRSNTCDLWMDMPPRCGPKTPAQRQFASAAVADAGAIERTRLLISLQLASPVSSPLVVNCRVLGIDPFCGFGLLSRINATTLAALGLRCFRGGQRVVLLS